MAMNKKEREALEFAEKELAIARALRWSRYEPLVPDVPVPKNGFTQGWQVLYEGRINYAWSEMSSHGSGEHPKEYPRTASQGGRALFSTKLLAMQAARYLMEREFAAKLAAIDAQIAELEKAMP